MSEEEHGIPAKGGSGGLIAIGVLMLLAAGGLVIYKTQSGEKEPEVLEEVTQVAEPEEAPAPVLENAPPPPPTEEEIEEEEKQEKQETTAVKGPSGPAGCAGTCAGQASGALRSALATRGASARSCYNTALRRNANLEGKMTVNTRLSPTGAVCSVGISNDTMGDPAVSACVAAKFRAAKFPAPTGGCLDVAVPLNFTSQQ